MTREEKERDRRGGKRERGGGREKETIIILLFTSYRSIYYIPSPAPQLIVNLLGCLVLDKMDAITYGFQFTLWHTADTGCAEICVSWLDTPQTAQVLVPRFLPLGNEVSVSVAFIEAVLVQL